MFCTIYEVRHNFYDVEKVDPGYQRFELLIDFFWASVAYLSVIVWMALFIGTDYDNIEKDTNEI